jgi:hypothetical protein
MRNRKYKGGRCQSRQTPPPIEGCTGNQFTEGFELGCSKIRMTKLDTMYLISNRLPRTMILVLNELELSRPHAATMSCPSA